MIQRQSQDLKLVYTSQLLLFTLPMLCCCLSFCLFCFVALVFGQVARLTESSPTRERTQAPSSRSMGALTTGPPGNFCCCLFFLIPLDLDKLAEIADLRKQWFPQEGLEKSSKLKTLLNSFHFLWSYCGMLHLAKGYKILWLKFLLKKTRLSSNS